MAKSKKYLGHILKLLAGSLAALIVTACTLHIAPDYSPETANSIVGTEKKIDKFYAGLTATPEDQRKFQAFSTEYQDVEVEIRALILRCKIEPMNDRSTEMATTLLDLWQKIESRHKQKDGYGTVLAGDDQERLDNLLTDMALVQQALKSKDTK